MNNRSLKKHLRYIIPQIRLAIIREPGPSQQPICTPDDIERYVEPLKHHSEEYFIAFHLDAKHHIVGYHEVSHGTLSASLVHPREVFKAALLGNSHALLVAHNHPGGTLTPSSEDLDTTETLVKAGKLLGVHVLDHIIVAFSGIASIRESHGSLFD